MIERIARLVRCDERGESRERSAITLLVMSRAITEHNTDIALYSTAAL